MSSALQAIALLVIASTLEASGDAIVRIALYGHAGLTVVRVVLFVVGGVVLFGYGTFLNLTPLDFRDVVGLYVATLFVVWQVINFAFFRTLPTLPTMVGGTLIVVGGAVMSFWKP
jgi:hypothetical protein